MLEIYLKKLANLKQQGPVKVYWRQRKAAAVNKTSGRARRSSLQDSKGMVLNIALNYGARQDILSACKQIANAVKGIKISSSQIDENMIARYYVLQMSVNQTF